jgi:hypothetical protein
MDFIGLLFYISLFLFGIIAVALIPSKDSIIKKQIKTFSLEKHVSIYIIAFILLLVGFFQLMAFFSEDVENQLIPMINAVFLEAIALGIMGLNYRSYHVFSEISEKDQLTDGRVEVAEVEAITDTNYQRTTTPISTTKKSVGKPIERNTAQTSTTTQMVECPQCKAAIKVDMSQRPVKISCPRCGIEGLVQ